MTKIDRYIIKKFLGTFLFIVMIFLVVSVVIDVAEKIDDFIEKKPPLNELIFEYYVDFMLFYGNLLSPICVFLAVIFFTSRLTQNTEIVAILSGGVSFWRLLAPYIGTGLFLAAVSFYMNAYLVPIATEERINFEYEYLKTKRVMDDINIHRKVGRDAEGAETYVYIYSFNQLINEGYIFSMERVKDGDILTKINCDRINWVHDGSRWLMHDCHTRYLTPTSEAIVFNKEIDTTFLLTPDDIYVKEMRAESLPLDKLYEYISLETDRGSDIVDELILEKYERWAYPFAAVVLTMIGFSVSTKKRRGGTALQLGIGLVLSFLYVTLVVAGQAMVGDEFPAWLAVWYPNILFFGLGVFLLRIAPK
ncbi:MAG: LptF/LptG family permease [Bacteroidia bacterium]|nr:LptF/LptG family permease [Bacteroidia bacterium]